MMDKIAAGPDTYYKGYVRNLALTGTGREDTYQFAFRPETVDQDTSANYQSQTPLGMSSELDTFEYTTGTIWRFELVDAALSMIRTGVVPNGDAAITAASDRIEADRRFLEALLVPVLSEVGQAKAAPPAVLLCVPGIVSARCTLRQLSIRFDRVDQIGRLRLMRAQTTWKAAPLGRVTMDDVLEHGSFIAWEG